MVADQWVQCSKVEAAWAQRTGAVVVTLTEQPTQGPSSLYVPPIVSSHIDRAEAGVIASQIDSLISFGLLLQRDSDILLPNEEARRMLKDARGTPDHRDRTVTVLVVDEEGTTQWLPRGPETDADISRIERAGGEHEQPNMVVACTRGHDPNYYVADNGRRKCRICRSEKPVTAPRSTAALS